MNEQYELPSDDESIELRLWEYLDGHSSAEEKMVIGQLLQTNALWKTKYGELLEVNELMRSSELEQPSMRFSKNVMEEIARQHIAPATKTYINKRIIWGIGVFFITMIVGFLVYGFGQVDWSTGSNSTLPIDLTNTYLNKLFSNAYVNVFMMINIVLGLFLLDRVLASKRKKYRGEI